MANRVFEDRVGLLVVNESRGVMRLPAIKAYAGGLIRDVFLPRTAQPWHFAQVRAAGLYAHLWIATHDRTAAEIVADTLADVARLKPGALELDLELASDPPLPALVAAVYAGIRKAKPKLRMRINLAPWKGFALPPLALVLDPNLYAAEQTYGGDMAPFSQADALADLLGWGAPLAKATVCYGAAGPVPGSPGRVCTLPNLSRWHRGVIFSDDLMAEVGLL